MRLARILLIATAIASGAGNEAVMPAGVKPIGPYSPGVKAGGLVYVSGQGALDAKGRLPAAFDAQARQCLENLKSVVQAAGLTMEHVVYAQVYLDDMKNYEALNKIYAEYFPANPPARSTIGVTRMPAGTPVEISAVAVRNLKSKKVLTYPDRKMPVPVSPAVQIDDRVYVTGGLGRDPNTGAVPKNPRDQVKAIMDAEASILKQANMELRHMVFATIYVSPRMPMKALAEAIEKYIPDETARTIVQTVSLPFGVDLQITGIASRDLKRSGNCTAVKDTMYCAGRAGTVRRVLESIKQDLLANGTNMDRVVSTNVYLDDIDQFAAMNKVYAGYFGPVLPARTTVQPWKKVAELSLPVETDARTEPDDSPRATVTVIATR